MRTDHINQIGIDDGSFFMEFVYVVIYEDFWSNHTDLNGAYRNEAEAQKYADDQNKKMYGLNSGKWRVKRIFLH